MNIKISIFSTKKKIFKLSINMNVPIYSKIAEILTDTLNFKMVKMNEHINP